MIEYLEHMNKIEQLQRQRTRRVGFGLCEVYSLKEEKEERNE